MNKFYSFKSQKQRTNKMVSLDKDHIYNLMASSKYSHIAINYFRNHKPYKCDYGEENNNHEDIH